MANCETTESLDFSQMEEHNRAKMYINLHTMKTPVRNEGQDVEWYPHCGESAQASALGLTASSVLGGNIGPAGTPLPMDDLERPPPGFVRLPPGLVVQPPPGL